MPRVRGIDSVKGIAILLVVASHMMPITVSGPPPAHQLQGALGLFGMYVMPIAVPAFYLTSLMLYFQRPAFARRMRRLAVAFAFWVGLQYALYAALFARFPPLDFETLSKGGPSLTGNAGWPTVFWFLFDLMVLLCVAEAFRALLTRAPHRARAACLVTIAGTMLGFAIVDIIGDPVPHWFVANFLVYVPLAWLLNDFEGDWRVPAAGWAVVSAVELAGALLRPDVGILAVSGYARIALPLGAVALVMWGAKAKAHPVLETVGRYSLGVYALHDTLRILALLVIPAVHIPFGGMQVALTVPAAIAALAGTALLTWLMSRGPLRPLVS